MSGRMSVSKSVTVLQARAAGRAHGQMICERVFVAVRGGASYSRSQVEAISNHHGRHVMRQMLGEQQSFCVLEAYLSAFNLAFDNMWMRLADKPTFNDAVRAPVGRPKKALALV